MSDETKSPNYWKSLNELAENKEYKKYVEREFQENASEFTDDVSRRSFLRIMGASIAMAGFASCRRPVTKILPYSRQPEDIVPGVPQYYASSMPFQDALTGVVVESNDGRPTKIEGNEMHMASRGATSIFGQAELLGLYDPDRSHYPRHNGEPSTYNAFQKFCSDHFSDRSRSVAFISEGSSSPTYHRLKEQALDRFSNARWVNYESFGEDNALEGTNMAFGKRLRTANHFDRAAVAISLDDDFLNPAANKNSVSDTKSFARARKVRSTDDEMMRFYAIESTYTLTGSNADNRLRLKSGEIGPFLYALAARLSERVNGLSAYSGYTNKFSDHEWNQILADELAGNRGNSILTVGPEHKAELHATTAAINRALGNAGQTVTYHRVPYLQDQNERESFANLVGAMNNGEIDTVVMVGTNPAFTAPADLNFTDALKNVDTSIHLSDYVDETSRAVNWHVNRAHFLEAWGDGYSFTGTRSVIQPLIQPLYSGASSIEFLHTVLNGEKTGGHELVKETWRQFYGANFQQRWKRILHDGVDTDGHFSEVSVSIARNFGPAARQFLSASEPAEGIELVIRPDSTLFDGRYANNGWLQELPDPMTKITWDNVALISQATADKLDIKQAGLGSVSVDVINIKAGDSEVELPVWIQPGHADDSITITVGYGRNNIGRVADGTGTDTYPMRTTKNMLYVSGVEVEKTGKNYKIACTQDHHSMEGRSLLRYSTLEEYRENPDFATYEESYKGELPGKDFAHQKGQEHPLAMFDPPEYPDYEPQWGMTIDLNACIGCGACTIACQAENNIPVVGKKEVSTGREMHWIRTDRYFEGDVDDPKALHQPVPCMHCELAPCEQVCPVAATTHSDDGMNQMAYNRCIGTRYCLNNCPYKVRRFNFFNYSDEFLTSGSDPEVVQMAMNPDVTVRFRGVMEKCTYCVQRVNRAKINTKIETNGATVRPPDGTVQTACQQVCPAEAITFGDLTDEESTVSTEKMNERNYLLLEELNTRPRTSYLAKLSNPNPKLV